MYILQFLSFINLRKQTFAFEVHICCFLKFKECTRSTKMYIKVDPCFMTFCMSVFLRFNAPLLRLCFYSISFWSNSSFLWSISNPLIKGALSRLRQFLPTKSPLKKMKNAFFSSWKLFLFLRYFNFCSEFLVL